MHASKRFSQQHLSTVEAKMADPAKTEVTFVDMSKEVYKSALGGTHHKLPKGHWFLATVHSLSGTGSSGTLKDKNGKLFYFQGSGTGGPAWNSLVVGEDLKFSSVWAPLDRQPDKTMPCASWVFSVTY